jgi:two-component system chemotaxis sensor kinase CheA
LTLAIIPALTVTSAGDRYAIPQVSLLELVRLEGEQARRGIELIQGAPVYRLRGTLLPLVYLSQQLFPKSFTDRNLADEINIVVLQADDRQFGLVVDAIHDTEEIVVKPLQKQLKGASAYSGATIMGDGKVALILDVLGLAQNANVVSGTRERALSEKTSAFLSSSADRQTVLLFATRGGGRMAIPLSMVARLEEFPRSSLERVGPMEVVQYRDQILPLIHVSELVGSKPGRLEKRNVSSRKRQRSVANSRDTVSVVVYSAAGRLCGLVVDRILDIAEEAIVSKSPATRPGILFTAVIQGKVTEFLDLEGVMQSADSEFINDPQTILAKG